MSKNSPKPSPKLSSQPLPPVLSGPSVWWTTFSLKVIAAVLFIAALTGGFIVGRRPPLITQKPIFASPPIPTALRPSIVLYTNSDCTPCRSWETALYRSLHQLTEYINFQPHFYFGSTDNLTSYCQSTRLDPKLCPQIFTYFRYPNPQACTLDLQNKLDSCQDPRSYITFPTDQKYYYSSTSRSVASQNLRFLCAQNFLSPKTWWQFYLKTVNSCTPQNFDLCWSQIVQQLSENSNNIVSCFNNQSENLLRSEYKFSQANPDLTLPSLIINGQVIPLTDQLINPPVLKQLVCSSFTNPPAACDL